MYVVLNDALDTYVAKSWSSDDGEDQDRLGEQAATARPPGSTSSQDTTEASGTEDLDNDAVSLVGTEPGDLEPWWQTEAFADYKRSICHATQRDWQRAQQCYKDEYIR